LCKQTRIILHAKQLQSDIEVSLPLLTSNISYEHRPNCASIACSLFLPTTYPDITPLGHRDLAEVREETE